MVLILKCRKCRRELVKQSTNERFVLSAHGQMEGLEQDEPICHSVDQDSLWFLEDSAVGWISDLIFKAQWTKGKLNCPNCEARIGFFDFVSQHKCACGAFVLPAVHLVKSKVDFSSVHSDPLKSLRSQVT